MNQRKQRKELEKAISNLLKYSEKAPWLDRQEYFFSERMIEAAVYAGTTEEALCEILEENDYMSIAFGYIFELFATCQWDNEDFSMVGDYLKRQAWRESPYAKGPRQQ